MDATSFWQVLPSEIEELILTFLSKQERKQLNLVCRKWHDFYVRRGIVANLHTGCTDSRIEVRAYIFANCSAINLSNCISITDNSLQIISKFCNKELLKTLTLRSCRGITGICNI